MATYNERPDLFGKPTLDHLIRAGLLTPFDPEGYGNYIGAYDSQGRLVQEDRFTRDLYVDPIYADDGSMRTVGGTPYDPVKELGVTALQQAGFLAADQYNAANYHPSEESGAFGTWMEGMKEGGLPLLGVMGAGIGLSSLAGAGAAGTGAGTFGAPTAAEMAAATAADATAFTPASLSAVAAAEGLPLAGAAGAGAGTMLGTGLTVPGVGAGAGAGAGTGTGAGGVGLGTAATGATGLASLKNILDNGGSVDDWLSVAGRAAPGLIGAYAANEQADAIRDVGGNEDARIREFMTYGAPSRERYEASFAPGFDITKDPALTGAMDTTTDTLLRRLSATGGNPYGNPGGLMEAEKYVMGNVALPYLQNYRNQNASTGGYGAFNTTAAGGGDTTKLNLAGINADMGMWGGLGDAASSVFTPKTSLDQLLKQLKGYGLGTTLA